MQGHTAIPTRQRAGATRLRNTLLGLLAASTLGLAATVQAGVTVSVGEPGFYGQISIGDFAPQPQLVYPQPVIIRSAPVMEAPVYLHVPPGQAKRWANYCNQYGACGRPVYFVQDNWYRSVYVPKYRAYHEREMHGGPHRDNGPGHGHGPDHYRGPDRGPDRGNGPGHGPDHGRGDDRR